MLVVFLSPANPDLRGAVQRHSMRKLEVRAMSLTFEWSILTLVAANCLHSVMYS